MRLHHASSAVLAVSMAAMALLFMRPEIRQRNRPDTLPSDSIPESGQGPVAPQRRTTQGLTLLQHDATAFARAPQWQLAAAPIAAAGGSADPSNDLTHARSIAILSDHRIVTFAAFETKLTLFDSLGGPGRELVRRGRGPGELAGAPNIAVGRGDTLVLPDMAEYRMQWLLPDRGVVRTDPLRGRVSSSAIGVVGMLPGGRAVLSSGGYVRAGELGRVTRSIASIYVLPRDSAAREVARVPDLDMVTVETRYEGRRGVEPLALGFGRSSHAVVWDTVIVTGAGEGYQLDVRNPSGRVLYRIVVAAPRRPVTAAMRRADIAERLRQLAEYRERPRDMRESQRLIRELPYADSLPPYSALFVSPNGTLWVVDPIAPHDSSWSATAYGSDGSIIGRLLAATPAPPVAFGDDRVVLRTTDADGVVSLSVHRILEGRR